jgi:hypothetical protein
VAGDAVGGRLVDRFLVDRFLADFFAPFFFVERFLVAFLAPFFFVDRLVVDFFAALRFFAIEYGSFRCSARSGRWSFRRGADIRGETSIERMATAAGERTAATGNYCR